jgi:hypothetical protein
MSAYVHPVFGPDRPRAAVAAFAELSNALDCWKRAYPSWESSTERLRRAREVAAMYYEYADERAALARC